MEQTNDAISNSAEGLRSRLADAERIQPPDLHAQLLSAVHARLGLQATGDSGSSKRGFLGLRRRATA